MDKASLLRLLDGSHQEHILSHFDDLNADGRAALARQITCGLDFSHLNNVLLDSRKKLDGGTGLNSTLAIEPPSPSHVFDVKSTRAKDPATIQRLEQIGLETIAKGHAAVLLLAGGSATRLRATVPKGFVHCDLLRENKSLFQLHAEKVQRVEQLAREAYPHFGDATCGRVQVLLMTSSENHDLTTDYFKSHGYFGLLPEQVHFFTQSSLPCYDLRTGKILMASDSSICMAPGGNGGVYESLARLPKGASESTLDAIRRQGVRYVQIFSVDNLLARLADPLFFGYTIAEEAHVVVKTTKKVSPEERVGVFAKVDSRWTCIEYTELGAERSQEVNEDTGELRYTCGNIASHTCSVEFLALAAERIKSLTLYHAAIKSITTRDGPVLGVKLESFIFDLFCYCSECPTASGSQDTFRIMQVDRSEEFGPIKNAEGAATDTASSAARLLLALHTHWALELLEKNSYISPQAQNALQRLRTGKYSVEISPLVSFAGEGLEEHINYLIDQIVQSEEEAVILIEKDFMQKHIC